VSWGYTFGLLAIGLMLFSLVVYGHVRDGAEGRPRGLIWVPGVLAAVAALLHPWQGELIILIVLGAEATLWWLDRRRPPIALPVITVIVTGAALLYYEALGRTDPSWKLAREASKHSFSLATILLAIVPLLIPALLAYPQRPRSFLAAATRLWPVAALAIYVLSASAVSATPLHSFEGITVPLSILAIQGIRRLPFKRLPGWPVLAVAAVLAATVPAMVSELATAKTDVAPEPGNANFITKDEHAAIRYLANDPQPGGVLSRFYLGTIVPAETGRRTYVGDCLWSEPNCPARAQITQMIFDEEVPAATSRWLVEQIGARFVLADCTTRPDMASVLAPITESVHRFGCATVYTVG